MQRTSTFNNKTVTHLTIVHMIPHASDRVCLHDLTGVFALGGQLCQPQGTEMVSTREHAGQIHAAELVHIGRSFQRVTILTAPVLFEQNNGHI